MGNSFFLRRMQQAGGGVLLYAIQESDSAIRYTGSVNGYGSGVAYGGSLNYGMDSYEVTVPPNCGRVLFSGYKDQYSCTVAGAYVNDAKVGIGDCVTNADPIIGNYFDFVGVKPGDIVRLAHEQGGGLLCDQISFYGFS